MKGAYVTLATNDSYSLGALVLAYSLKQVGTTKDLAILVTPGVTSSMRARLTEVFNLVQEVNLLDSGDKENLKLLQRPELGVTFTKLHCWRLEQYDKCVFLDADTLVLQNCDELFEREELSAAPDVGWPDCFNSGVFVYKPSPDTYKKLIEFALEKGSFDGGDQGLLNQYFSDWAFKDISKHLPFIYNVCSTAFYSYLPAFKQYGKNIKIIHFIGNSKPWLQYFDTVTRKVRPSRELDHLQLILQKWWDIFCNLIHQNLSSDMSGLAGAFARITLGQQRTPEQEALESSLRRQNWEQGVIDYLGRDSFDNIWSKICETLAGAPEQEAVKPETTEQVPLQPTDTETPSEKTAGKESPKEKQQLDGTLTEEVCKKPEEVPIIEAAEAKDPSVVAVKEDAPIEIPSEISDSKKVDTEIQTIEEPKILPKPEQTSETVATVDPLSLSEPSTEITAVPSEQIVPPTESIEKSAVITESAIEPVEKSTLQTEKLSDDAVKQPELGEAIDKTTVETTETKDASAISPTETAQTQPPLPIEKLPTEVPISEGALTQSSVPIAEPSSEPTLDKIPAPSDAGVVPTETPAAQVSAETPSDSVEPQISLISSPVSVLSQTASAASPLEATPVSVPSETSSAANAPEAPPASVPAETTPAASPPEVTPVSVPSDTPVASPPEPSLVATPVDPAISTETPKLEDVASAPTQVVPVEVSPTVVPSDTPALAKDSPPVEIAPPVSSETVTAAKVELKSETAHPPIPSVAGKTEDAQVEPKKETSPPTQKEATPPQGPQAASSSPENSETCPVVPPPRKSGGGKKQGKSKK